MCATHGGRAPQVRKKAIERIIAASDLAAARLIEFMNDKSVPYNVRPAATRDLLDRGIGPAAQTIKLGLGDADPWADLLAEVMNDDVLERYNPNTRALPARRVGGGDDDEDDRAMQVVEYDPDPDVSSDDLSWNTPGTIRGEVVPTPEQRAHADRTAARVTSLPMDDEANDRALSRLPSTFDPSPESIAPADDPDRPPAYVREAMESDGQPWRGPNDRERGPTWTR